MRTRPGGPSTALGWDAGAFPWIFPSLFPPAPTTPAHCGHLHPAPPPSPRPGTGPGWLCPIPWGLVASPSSERLKSPHLAGHVASRWQPRPFPQPWGCSYSSAPSSIEPNPPPPPHPGLQHPSNHSCPPAAPSSATPTAFTLPPARETCPSWVPCPPASPLPPCSMPPLQNLTSVPLCVPLHPRDALPRLCPCSHSLRTEHVALAYFGLQPQKYLQADPVPCPGIPPVLCPLFVLSVPNSAHLQPGPALHNVLLPAQAASPAASSGMQVSRPEQLQGAAETRIANTEKRQKR